MWLQGMFNPGVLRVLNEAKGALSDKSCSKFLFSSF